MRFRALLLARLSLSLSLSLSLTHTHTHTHTHADAAPAPRAPQILSDLDTRHGVAESMLRGGAATAGICYQVMLLGLVSKQPGRKETQLRQLADLQAEHRRGLPRLDIKSAHIDTAPFKTVLELQDVAGRDRFKDAAAIDRAVKVRLVWPPNLLWRPFCRSLSRTLPIFRGPYRGPSLSH